MNTIDVVCVASWNVDLIAHVPRPLQRGETGIASHFDKQPGGKGSNAAIAAARQGAQVGLIARIGQDDFGQMALDLWAHEGMHAQHVVQAAHESSGTALILVYADGDNSIAVYPGAGLGLSAADVQRARAMLGQAKLVMASCEVPVAATLAAFEIARAHGVTTLLNPAPAMPLPGAIWPLVDVLTPNEGELLMLSGQDTVHDAAHALLARGVGHVVVTLGAQGCALYRAGQAPYVLAGHRVAVADTIGAGDTFTGNLAARLARGDDITHAMQWANMAAALSTQSHGATTAMPIETAVAQALSSAKVAV